MFQSTRAWCDGKKRSGYFFPSNYLKIASLCQGCAVSTTDLFQTWIPSICYILVWSVKKTTRHSIIQFVNIDSKHQICRNQQIQILIIMFHSVTCKYRTPLVTVRLLAPSLCHYQDKINTEEVFIQTFRDKKRLIESLVEWKKWVKVLTFTNIIIASYCNTCGQI